MEKILNIKDWLNNKPQFKLISDEGKIPFVIRLKDNQVFYLATYSIDKDYYMRIDNFNHDLIHVSLRTYNPNVFPGDATRLKIEINDLYFVAAPNGGRYLRYK